MRLAFQSSPLHAAPERVCGCLTEIMETRETQMKFPQIYTLCKKMMGY